MAIYIGSQKPKFYLGDQKVKAIWLGGVKVYSAGNIVTYHVDTGITYQEEVDEGASCLSPKSFTPAKSGWTFLGWRTDAGAYESVYNSLVMGDAPVTLYAVFVQTITLSYNGNGATGGSTAAQTGTRCYNNGNVVNPTFTVRANAFGYSNYTFVNWALNGVSGTRYAPNSAITLSGNASMYAIWIGTPFTWVSNYKAAGGLTLNVSRWGWCRNTGISGSDTVQESSDLGKYAREIKNNQPAYEYDACGFQSTLSGITSRKTKYINITYGIYSPAGNGNYNGPGILYVNANGTRIYTLTLTGKQENNITVKVALPDSDANIVIGLNGAVDAGMFQTPSGNISSVTFTNS